ncbi:MAG: endopeptidase La [Candidatus Zixiibacteriota bacterium]|nr:MAG: endopeptidase La [candidate division Zixibacteria bacterium]
MIRKMIKKTGLHIPLLASDGEPILPILPTRTLILFPGETVSIQVGRPENLALVKDNTGKNRLIGVTYSPDNSGNREKGNLSQIGTAAKIISVNDGPGGSKIISLEGIRRIALKTIVRKKPYLTARISYVDEKVITTGKTAGLSENIIKIIEQITNIAPTYSAELPFVMKFNMENPGKFADKIAASFHFPINSKQEILQTCRLDPRLEKTLRFLEAEFERVTISYEIKKTVEEKDIEERRKHFLREQLYEIKRQLGDVDIEDRAARQLKMEVKNNKRLTPEVRERALIEVDRLSHLSTASAEYGATKLYLDWLQGIPWNVCGEETYDLDQVEADIGAEYYGSQKIKKQILERIAIRKLHGGLDEGAPLCLAGAPGTGKASLARAIAKALGKKFVRISAGALVDISDIKGTARTYLGAMPGIFIRTLKEAGTCDPIILIEDVETLAEEANTVLPMAMLEAIDPRYNSNFLDNYIGLPIDLSRAIFICSVRSSDEIPEVLNHRLEVVELPGYIEKEKIHIARKYLIPKILRKHGLKKSDVKFSESGVKKIIRSYTMEAGLLGLTREVEKICRHIARKKAGKVNKKWSITDKTVEKFLGTPVYIPEMPEKSSEIGVCIGLAWTGSGGDLMIIEGLRMKGSGEVITTGSLGEVMKESIQAAHSYVHSKADVLGIDHNDFSDFDIHIHFPSGAIPKDGPSAGVTVSLVIASVMAERPIRNDIAMTGEVTLRGRVLSVGGIKEKISAAYRAGIKTIMIPRENKKDLKDLPADIIKETEFVFIDTIDEVFEKGLLDYTPSSYTLEKIFAKEIEKAKKKKKRKSHSRKITARSSRRNNR